MWTVRSRRRLQVEVSAPPDAVRTFYCDLHNMTKVHPLVVSVRCTEQRSTADGDYHDYRIEDRIPMGPVAMTVRYRASVLVTPDGVAHTEARQFPAVRLSGTVTFDPSAGGTTITECIDIAAPRPLAAYTVRQATAAHATLLERIADYFGKNPA